MLRIKVFRNAYTDELEKEISRWMRQENPEIHGEPKVAVSDSGNVAIVFQYEKRGLLAPKSDDRPAA